MHGAPWSGHSKWSEVVRKVVIEVENESACSLHKGRKGQFRGMRGRRKEYQGLNWGDINRTCWGSYSISLLLVSYAVKIVCFHVCSPSESTQIRHQNWHWGRHQLRQNCDCDCDADWCIDRGRGRDRDSNGDGASLPADLGVESEIDKEQREHSSSAQWMSFNVFSDYKVHMADRQTGGGEVQSVSQPASFRYMHTLTMLFDIHEPQGQ
jgi:hypothetical protein